VRVGAKRWAQVGPKPNQRRLNQRRLNQVAEPPGSALRRHVAGLGRCAGRLVPEHHDALRRRDGGFDEPQPAWHAAALERALAGAEHEGCTKSVSWSYKPSASSV
jgi:hypothetical protein